MGPAQQRHPGQQAHLLAGHHQGHLLAPPGQLLQLLEGLPGVGGGQDPVVGPEPPAQVGGQRLHHPRPVVDQVQDRVAHGDDGDTDRPGAFPGRPGLRSLDQPAATTLAPRPTGWGAAARFQGGSPGKGAAWERVRTWEVAIVSMGPDDSREDRDERRTEDVGLPEHERDESRVQAGGTGEDDPAEVAAMTDASLSNSTGLPEHEDDARRAEDTGTGEQNP